MARMSGLPGLDDVLDFSAQRGEINSHFWSEFSHPLVRLPRARA